MEARVIVLLAVSAGVFAGPLNPTFRDDPFSCSTKCTDSNKFQYQPGMTYEYNYDALTQTSMNGASEDQATIRMTAKAKMEVLSKCEFVLKLSDVALYTSDPENPSQLTMGDNSGDFQQSLEDFPLKFSFQDGIVDELCPDDSESEWSLNIKRGILTAFQNSMHDLNRDQRVQEADVTGSCITDYRVTQRGWQSLTVKKTKTLDGCSDRHGYKTALHAMPYKIASAVQSLPLMKSNHECDQIIKTGGVLQKTTCHEMHIFRPFSKDTNGALTESTQTLEFLRSYNFLTTSRGFITKRAKMTFKHKFGTRDEDKKKRDASHKLEELCRVTVEDIRPDVPAMFSELVYIMREMDARSLERLYEQVKRGSICRNNARRTKTFFIDAIPMVGTSASLRLMRKVILAQEVDKDQANMWLTSLAFIQNPTRDMIDEIEPLMESDYVKGKAGLSITSLVNNYCNKDSSCMENREVMKIVQDLQNDIGSCHVTDSNLINTLYALRAVGNLGQFEQFSFSLEKCFSNKNNPTEIRVTALEAFRRLPCSSDRNNVMEVFLNTDEDSELRIAAYIAVMQCPVQTFLDQIKSNLESEKADQVGSFVWSHLTNLMETSSPMKQTIKKILEDEDLKKEFDMDKRKFSRNYEGSFFLEKINSGAMVESNVIWSSASFLPRSAMVNFTVDLFGQSVNFLDIGGRVEGLEYLLESYFGPEGLFKEKDDTKGYADTKTIRKEKMKRQKERYNQLKDKFRASLYVRVFGNELQYKHFDTLNPSKDDIKFNIIEQLMKLSKNNEYAYTHSFMFLDSSLIIPTCTGLPLNLTVNGTATIDMKASGKFDVRNFKSKRNMLIDGQLQPSGALEIVSAMSVDAFVTKAGLKMVSTLHSSSSVKGKLELSGGNIFSLEFDLPKDKTEIFDFKSRFFIEHDNHQREQRMIEENRKYKQSCWGNRLTRFTGVELCGEVGFPNASMNTKSPYFPFTGPVDIGFVLHKRDLQSGYKMVVRKIHNKETTLGQIAFDTPGSKVNRALSLDFTLMYKTKEINIALNSPWKKANVKGEFTNTDSLKKVTAKLMVDDRQEYFISTKIPIEKKGKTTVYSPSAEVRWPNSGSINFSGMVSHKSLLDRVEADLSVTGVTANSINLHGLLVNTDTVKSLTGSVMLKPKQEYSVAAKLLKNKTDKKRGGTKLIPTLVIKTPKTTLLSAEGTVEFKKNKYLKTNMAINMKKHLKEPIRITSSFSKSDSSNTKKLKYKGSVKVQSEYITSKLSGNFDYNKKTSNTRVMFDYNIPKVIKNKITFGCKVINRSTASLKKYDISVNMDAKHTPDYNFLLKMNVNHNKELSEVNIKAKHGITVKDKNDSRNQLTASVSVNHRNIFSEHGSVDYTIRAEYPSKKIHYLVKADHGWSKNSFTSSFDVRSKRKSVVEARIRIRNQTKKYKQYDALFSLVYPGRNFSLFSNFTETKQNEYLLMLKVQHQEGLKSTAVAQYKVVNKNEYDFSTDIQIHGYDLLHVDALAKLNWQDFRTRLQSTYRNDRFGIDISSSVDKKPYGKWSAMLQIPSIILKASADGGKKGKKYVGNTELAWEADNNERGKIAVETDFIVSVPKGEPYKIGGKIHVTTPFEDFTNIECEMSYVNKNKHFTYMSKVDWGGKNKRLSVDVDLIKPFNINNIRFVSTIITPFEGYSTIEAILIHKYDKALESQLTGRWDDDYIDVQIKESHIFSKPQRHLEAEFEFKSSIPDYSQMGVILKHNDNGNKIQSRAEANNNGRKYSFDLNASVIKTGWDFKLDGTLYLICPSQTIRTSIHHSHLFLNSLNTTFSSEYNRNQKVLLQIIANHENRVNREISGNIILQTPWDGMRDIEINVNHKHNADFMQSTSVYKADGITTGKIDVNFKKEKAQIDFDFLLRNPYTSDFRTKLNSRYGRPYKTGHFEVEWSRTDKISVDGFLDLKKDTKTYNADLRITTPFEEAHSIQITSKSNLQENERISELDFNWGHGKFFRTEIQTRFDRLKKIRAKMFTSVFKKLKNIDLGFDFTGDIKNTLTVNADMEVKPVFEKISTSLHYTLQPELYTKLKIDTPFKEFPSLEVTSSSQSKNLEYTRRHLEIKYFPQKVLRADVTYNIRNWQNMNTSLEIKTPFSVMPELKANLLFKKTEMAMEGKAVVETPFTEVKEVKIIFTHLQTDKVVQTNAEVTYGTSKQIKADVNLLMNDGIDGSFTLMSPFDPVRRVHLSLKHNGKKGNFISHAQLNFGEKRFEAETNFNYGTNTTGSFSIKTPYKGLEDLKAEFSKQGPLSNSDIRGSIVYGNMNKRVEGSLKQNFDKSHFFVSTLLKSPYTSDFALTMDHKRTMYPMNSKIVIALGNNYTFSSDFTVTKDDKTLSVNINAVYKWKQKNGKAEIFFKNEGDYEKLNLKIVTAVEGVEIKINSGYNKGDKVKGNINMKLPLEKFPAFGFSFEHITRKNGFVTTGNVNWNNIEEIQAKIDLFKIDLKRLEVTADVTTSFKGYENSYVHYEHNIKKNSLKGEAKFAVGKIGPYGLKLESAISSEQNYEYVLTAATPHKGYKHVRLQGDVSVISDLISVSGQSEIGKFGVISLHSTFNIKSDPKSLLINVKTPYNGFESIFASVTLQNKLDNFKMDLSFDSTKTGKLTTEMSSRYVSYNDMNAHLAVKTVYNKLKNLNVMLERSKHGPEYHNIAELQWNSKKPIKVEITHTLPEKDFYNEISITTPYKDLQSFSWKIEHKNSSSKLKDLTKITYNNKTYFDAEIEYEFSSIYKVSTKLRQPRQMEAKMSYRKTSTEFSNELYINWNKSDPESNVHFVTDYNNRSPHKGTDSDFQVKVIHPARILGIEGTYKKLPTHFHQKALITWDQTKHGSIAYDVEWMDRSNWLKNEYESSVMIVLPIRSIKATAAYSNSSTSRFMDASFLWDADRDVKKQVGLTIDCDIDGKKKKTDFTLHVPAIEKDYKLGTEIIHDEGNTIFDGRLDFSYSKQPEKTIILTSKLEKINWNEITGDRNYSLAFGVTHAATDVDVKVSSHIGRMQSTYSAGVDMLYLTADSKRKNIALRGAVDRLRQEIELQAATPLQSVYISGRMDRKVPYHLTVKKVDDNMRSVSADMLVDPRTRNLELSLVYDADKPQNKILVSAKYLNDSAVEANLFHAAGADVVSESMIAVRLNSSHILHTRITWRPTAVVEIQRYFSKKSHLASYKLIESLKNINEAIALEVLGKYNAIARELSQELEPVFGFLKIEMSDMTNSLTKMQTQMRRAYRRNDLYIRDLGQSLNMGFDMLIKSLRKIVYDFNQFCNETEMALTYFTNSLKSYPVAHKYDEFVSHVVNRLKMGRQIIQAKINELSFILNGFSEKLYLIYLDRSRKLHRKLQDVMQHPHMQKIQRKYGEIMSNINALPDIDYSKYASLLDNHIQTVLQTLEMKDTYNKMIHNSNQVVRKHMNAVLNDPDVQKAHVILNEMYQQGKWAYNYWKVDGSVRSAMMKLYDITKDALFKELNTLKNIWIDLDRSRIIIFDPQRGELQFEIYLPIPLKSLAHPPSEGINDYVTKARKFVNRYVPGSKKSVWNSYYKELSSLDTTRWLQPFDAYASVVGNQHFITFDKTHFEFAGRCSYVLARDMIDDNFTVILNYNNNPRDPKKESILIMMRGVNIEVDQNSKVKVNDRHVELPFSQKKITALKVNHVIRIKDGTGLLVEIDPEHDIHTIQISTWYHGRTAGLLGTFDNDKSNDMMTSSHEVVDDVTKFANSWEVGQKSCRSINAAKKLIGMEDKNEQCTELFKSTKSSLSRCFTQIDNEQFYNVCMRYTETMPKVTEAKCLAAVQYHHLCRKAGYYVQVPPECVSCSTINQETSFKYIELTAGGENPVPYSADVVIVFEEKKNDRWTPVKLGQLVQQINRALSASGLANNMFGLVGYGGPHQLNTEHSHTFDGQLFGTAVSFLKGVEDIEYSVSKTPGNALDALRYATHLPFRTGVSKIMIFIPAMACEASLVSSDMEQHLKSNGFTMHILRDERINVGRNKVYKNTHVFGMDNQQLITFKNRKNKNSAVLNGIILPTDQCTSLALATNGSVFDSSYLTATNPRVQQDFIHKFSTRIGKTAAPPQCQKCTCEQDGYGKGKSVCKPCDKSFSVWNYIPNWWTSNRTPMRLSDLDQFQEYLAMDLPLTVKKA